MSDDKDSNGAAVPTGRAARLWHFGGMATGIAGSVAAGGLRALAGGQRPDLAQLLLTPANTLRLTDGLSHLRGAALKLGQMLSMDTGLVLSGDLTAILGRMRDDARHMPPKQLQTALNAEWGERWYGRLARFDVRPFAAASIGQVHRAVTRDGQALAIKVQYPGVRASIDSDGDNVATLLRLPGLLPRGMDIGPLFVGGQAPVARRSRLSGRGAASGAARIPAGGVGYLCPSRAANDRDELHGQRPAGLSG